MHYIKDIFEGNIGEHAHTKFIRYSKGEFVGPLIKIKVAKKQIKVNGSFHISDEILKLFVELLGEKTLHIKGTLSWNKDLNDELESSGIKYLKVSKARGIFNYKLDNDIELKSFVDKMVKYNVLLNFKEDDYKVSMKPKFPKPNKEVTADFLKSMFPISMKKRILEEFAFDVKEEFKDIDIEHKILIEDIEYPKDDNMSFEEIRRQAKRVGKLIRTITVDGKDPIVQEIKIRV